ncbi:hypothetical protein DPMN_128956 [Dreissena polymorpha]|uniref:Uncharacterized protein n=1 Tax=Dreissena polymorpha TaxID=45954 RepID=A0A9D4K0M4_DREPO|nr:hypothetical protein DPMN_128956 [Dreissena polymorpha]
MGHFHYLHRPPLEVLVCISATGPPRPSSTLPHPPLCSRPSFGDGVKPLFTSEQLPFRLAILLSSRSQLSECEMTTDSRDKGIRWFNRAARISFSIRPSSDDVKNHYQHTDNYHSAWRFFGHLKSSRKSSAGDSRPGRDVKLFEC